MGHVACGSFDVHLLALVIKICASSWPPFHFVTFCAHWSSCCVIICLCSWATHLAHRASPENQGCRRPEGHDTLSHIRCTRTRNHLDPRWRTNSGQVRSFGQWHFIDKGRDIKFMFIEVNIYRSTIIQSCLLFAHCVMRFAFWNTKLYVDYSTPIAFKENNWALDRGYTSKLLKCRLV